MRICVALLSILSLSSASAQDGMNAPVMQGNTPDILNNLEVMRSFRKNFSVDALPTEIKSICAKFADIDTFDVLKNDIFLKQNKIEPFEPFSGTSLFESGAASGKFIDQLSITKPTTKLDKGRAVALDTSATQALRRVYQSTGSSGKAKAKVKAVLAKHGCNGDPVDSISIQDTVEPVLPFADPGYMRPRVVTGADMTCEYRKIAWTLSARSDSPIGAETLRQSLDFGTLPVLEGSCFSDPSQAQRRWSSVNKSDVCAKLDTRLRQVCNGEITAESEFAKRNNANPEFALEPVETMAVIALVGTLWGAYESHVSAKEAELSREQSSARVLLNLQEQKVQQEIQELNRQREFLDQQNRDFKNMEDAQSAIIGEGNPGLLDSSKLRSDNSARIKEIDGRIEEKRSEIEDIDKKKIQIEKEPDFAKEIIKDAKGKSGSSIPVDFDGFQNYINGQWNSDLKKLAKGIGNCNGMKNIETIIPADVKSSTVKNADLGESCKIDAAISELNTAAAIDFRKPQNLVETFDERERLRGVFGADYPICGPEPCSDAVMDSYYKKKGYDGGKAEFCAVNTFFCFDKAIAIPDSSPLPMAP